jgi:hypothetical protein
MFHLCFDAVEQSPISHAFCFLILHFQITSRIPQLFEAHRLYLFVFLSFSSISFLLVLALEVAILILKRELVLKMVLKVLMVYFCLIIKVMALLYQLAEFSDYLFTYCHLLAYICLITFSNH